MDNLTLFSVGPDATDWPRQQDPAMIAPYLCKQQISQDFNVATRAGVYYRLVMRQSMFGRGSGSNINPEGNFKTIFNRGEILRGRPSCRWHNARVLLLRPALPEVSRHW